MPIRVCCPGCGKAFQVREELAGQRRKCPSCQAALEIPAAQQEVVLPEQEEPPPPPTFLPVEPAPPRRKVWPWAVAGVAVLALVAGGGFFLLKSKQHQGSESPAPASTASTGGQPTKPDAKPKPKPALAGSKARFPVGKDTTVVDGPLDAEGYIDYEAALNEKLAKGITPASNASVLLWQACGPRPQGAAMPAEFFKALGIAEPPARGDYFLTFHAYLKDHLKLDMRQLNSIFDQQAKAAERPWTAKDYPHVASWLTVNDKPLALVIEASKRPAFFHPHISSRTMRGSPCLMASLLAEVDLCRDFVWALTARAMLRVGQNKYDEAWQDLYACHRLARLAARSGMLVETFIAMSMELNACNADLVYLERVPLTAARTKECLADLQKLALMPDLADQFDLGERFLYLDCMQIMRRFGPDGFLKALDGRERPVLPEARIEQFLAAVDWGLAFRSGNQWYDRYAAVLRGKDRPEREKQLDKLDDEVEQLKKNSSARQRDARKLFESKQPINVMSKELGDIILTLLIRVSIRKTQESADRVEQVHRNLHVAFALAASQRAKGQYPAKLDDLVPDFLATVPDDLFTGRPLVYKPDARGCLVYSAGGNGKDDGGRRPEDNPPGDDIVVRLTLPEPVVKKPDPVPDKPVPKAGPVRNDLHGDPLPDGARVRMGTVKLRHGNSVRWVSWSPDGKLLASASDDHTIRLWAPATGKEIRQLLGHESTVFTVCWSPDSKTIASGGLDDTVRLWDPATGKEMRKLTGHKRPVTCVTWSPDGKLLVSGGWGKTIRLWDPAAGKEVHSCTGHLDSVAALTWSPDSKTFASASKDKTVRLWDAATGKETRILKGHKAPVRALNWSPTGKLLASGGKDDLLMLWDPATGRLIRSAKADLASVWALNWAPDGELLASAGTSIIIWDPATLKEFRRLKQGGDAVTWSPDGKMLAWCGDTAIHLWDWAQEKEVPAMPGHRLALTDVKWSPTGKVIASTTFIGRVRLWDAGTGKEIHALEESSGCIFLGWSAGGKILATSDSRRITFWDPATGKSSRSLELRGAKYWYVCLSWSRDGKLIAAACSDKIVRLLDASTGQVLVLLRGHQDESRSLSWSPDGKLLASGSRDKTVRIWDRTGKLLRTLPQADEVMGLAWSPDSKHLAAGQAYKCQIWDIATGKQLHTFKTECQIHSLSWSPDGKALATAGPAGKGLQLWDTATGTVARSLTANHAAATVAAFAPDGKSLAAGNADCTILIWDVSP